jgi:hypothetical protein
MPLSCGRRGAPSAANSSPHIQGAARGARESAPQANTVRQPERQKVEWWDGVR